MRACNQRKQFGAEWEAIAWIQDNPREQPAAPLFPYQCPMCHQWHVAENPEGKRNGTRRQRR